MKKNNSEKKIGIYFLVFSNVLEDEEYIYIYSEKK